MNPANSPELPRSKRRSARSPGEEEVPAIDSPGPPLTGPETGYLAFPRCHAAGALEPHPTGLA